jgi:aminopeptidase N
MKLLLPLLLHTVYSFAGAQSAPPNPAYHILHYSFYLELNDENDMIKGDAVIIIAFLQDTKNIDLELVKRNSSGKGMVVNNVRENNNVVLFDHNEERLRISTSVKAGDTIEYTVSYRGIPADGLIIAKNKYGHRTFFGDNWPNRAHHWLPCIDNPAAKAPVDFMVTAPEHYQIVANGVKVEENYLPFHQRFTHWQETTVLPTKVMVIGAADFAVNYPGNADCIPVTSWVYPEDKEKGFYDYALAKDILPYFIKNVGPYPYQKLANVQSKTMFGGMENASAIFYFENSVVGDRKLESLLTHEIAHQWFGNSATEISWPHVWLSEGFATYMTHLYLENKYGVDSLRQRLKEDRSTVIEFSKKRNTPIVDSSVNSNFIELLNANSYQKGGWALHMLRRKMGDSLFWQGIKNYYNSYAGKNASTDDFQKIMETASGMDLQLFFKQWLHTAGQPVLSYSWKYNAGRRAVIVTVKQTQPGLFEFPLQIAAQTATDTSYGTLDVKSKINLLAIPVSNKPVNVVLDPHIDMLFEELK